MASQHPLKIFVSYASGDREQAQKLYAYLASQGAAPWIDTEDLLPGQDWKVAISQALDETDIVLLCLSKKSVSREGYVQKEMRLALDRALEIPSGEIFLIPCRFEEVDLPYSLREFQWVDIFTESGMRKLLKSLSLRAEKVGASPLYVDGAPVAEIKREKSPPKRRTAGASSSKNVEVHIHGNVSDSNIVIGDGNTATNTSND
ncbi:MAG: toll/interleukin-1 receptor domain-containing protein [Anaerolineales bacterium]|nr:toll/interleukin-1 receptor domain-containing protein [Anaerolineales bacterium]